MANANARNTSREGSASCLGQGDGGYDRREGFGRQNAFSLHEEGGSRRQPADKGDR